MSVYITVASFFSGLFGVRKPAPDDPPAPEIAVEAPSAVDPSKGQVFVYRENRLAEGVTPTADGQLLCAWSFLKKIHTKKSDDGGQTWTKYRVAAAAEGLNCTNASFFTFEGRLFLAYRATGETEDGFYSSLRVSVSEKNGNSWDDHSIIIENTESSGAFRGVWEPWLGEIDGKLVCLFSNDSSSVTTKQNIEMMTWDGERWGDRRVISNGEAHQSRDGMPAWCALQGGGYACVIESTKYKDAGHPFAVQLLTSSDGRSWSEPKDIYIPAVNGALAAAPQIAQLADGRLVVTFQTDEDDPGENEVSKLIYTSKTETANLLHALFSAPTPIFTDKTFAYSTWGRLYTDGKTLYYAAGTPLGATCNHFN